jgi:hypothetical protein
MNGHLHRRMPISGWWWMGDSRRIIPRCFSCTTLRSIAPITSTMTDVVFESLVRSGLLAHFWKDRDRDWSTLIPEWKKTRQDRRKPVFCSLLRSFAVLRPVFGLFGLTGLGPVFWLILDTKVFTLHPSFNMSLRTLIYVKYWCSYKNIRWHILFPTMFY